MVVAVQEEFMATNYWFKPSEWSQSRATAESNIPIVFAHVSYSLNSLRGVYRGLSRGVL